MGLPLQAELCYKFLKNDEGALVWEAAVWNHWQQSLRVNGRYDRIHIESRASDHRATLKFRS
jgi:hypothetical protein